MSEKGCSGLENAALFASPGGRNESYLEGVLLVFVPVLRSKGGSKKPTPRERLPRQILGELCIMPVMRCTGGPGGWKPARRIEPALCKVDREGLKIRFKSSQ